MVPYCLRLLIGFGDKVQFDLDFELAPTCFSDFERRRLNGTKGVGVGFVELKGDLLDEVGEVGVGGTGANVDGPLVGMVGVYVRGSGRGIDEFGDGAED